MSEHGGVRSRLRAALRPGPTRTLVAGVAADSVGQGILIATTPFYMLRIVDLTAAQVGVGLTVAAILGILVSAPIGRAADHWNPLPLTVVMISLQAVAALGLILVDDLTTYIAATGFHAIAVAAAAVTGAAMLPTIMPPEQRVKTRATTRVTTNAGISVGVALGGVVVGVGSATLYHVGFAVIGAGLLVSAFFFSRLKRYQRERIEESTPEPVATTDEQAPGPVVPEPSAPQVLRDRPFLAVTMISAVLAVNDGLLTVALPLWISQATSAPPWIYSVAIVLNTLAVVVFQIPLSRWSETPKGAGQSLRWSGFALAAACLLWAAAGTSGSVWWVAAALLVVGAGAHVVGELTSSAGGWGLSYSLAPENAHGRYQGVFGTGQQITNAVMPLIAGAFLINRGFGGWALMAGVLLAAGLSAPLAVTWAERTPPRTRPAEPAADNHSLSSSEPRP